MASGNKKCTVCGITKPLSSFNGNRKKCNDCRTLENKERANSSLEGFLTKILTSLKQRHKAKNYEGATVSLDYLSRLYDQQRGICAISNIPMHISTDHSDFSVSPDRIDTSKGYIEGNIRLVCARVNLMRGAMNDHDLVWWCRAVVNSFEN